jgi:Homeodomain-like domain
VAEWQTRELQVLVSFGTWRFDSSHPHFPSRFVHSPETVAKALRLSRRGLNDCEIARRTGVPRPTVRDWRAGKLPHSFQSKPVLYGRRRGPGSRPNVAAVGTRSLTSQLQIVAMPFPSARPRHEAHADNRSRRLAAAMPSTTSRRTSGGSSAIPATSSIFTGPWRGPTRSTSRARLTSPGSTSSSGRSVERWR